MLILIIISIIIIFINFLISKKILLNREKISPFECGFDPISSNHIPFRIQFFIISLIFLIFDIEITLLIPLIYLSINNNIYIIFYSFVFLVILILGLYIEYIENSID